MSIRVEELVNGRWCFYCFLVRGADRKGHYGAAADAWCWARRLVADAPSRWRIVDEGADRRPHADTQA